jgi:diaminopimelate epimerase
MKEFEKWHGLGNDFIVTRERVSAEDAVRLCDRRRGIGADGVLVVERSGDSRRMVVFNADGSRPEMCGNGLRCVVAHLAQEGPDAGDLSIETDAGLKRCHYERQAGDRYCVQVDMGVATLGDTLRGPAGLRGYQRVDIGNPHAVSFDRFEESDVDVDGPAIEAAVAGGCNVEWVRVHDAGRRLEVVVWERGVGRTEACGTGACAVAAAAVASQRSPADCTLAVILPGGQLDIVVSGPPYQVSMTGLAVCVFRGDCPPTGSDNDD